MLILVTNDDGIESDGLTALVDALKSARSKEGAAHEIVVVAPEGERSGVSHSMTLKQPTKLRRVGEARYSCSGTPVDCIIVAGLAVLKRKPDLVVSGINRGSNLGTDIVYSGTCGAARQAALSGVPAIAVSCAGLIPPFLYGASASFVAENLEALAAAWRPGSFLNVNGPNTDETGLGARWTIPGRNHYFDDLHSFEGKDGYTYCFLADGRHEQEQDLLSDHQAVLDGLIAVGLISVHPESAHPADWNGKAFKAGGGPSL